MQLNDSYCIFHSQIRLKMEWEEEGGWPEFSRYLETFMCTVEKNQAHLCFRNYGQISSLYMQVLLRIFSMSAEEHLSS